jgi:hypothetical protein
MGWLGRRWFDGLAVGRIEGDAFCFAETHPTF